MIKMGAIKQSDSIEDLAASFKLPIEQMMRTYAEFQKAVRGETRDPLDRKEFEALPKLPYFGLKVTAALFNTQGG
jgi:hypothetical protein